MEPSNAPNETLATGSEWQLRVDLAAACRLVALHGWDDLIFTHLSVRIPGPEHHFLINPYNLMFEEMTASALVKIDVDGHAVGATAATVNPAGFTIHSALHMAREDAQAVIHLHTACGQAVSAMRDGLLPHTQTAMIAIHDLSYHAYEGIATNHEERARLAADLADRHSMLLRNHGTLSVGASIGAAFLRIYLLERACEAQVAALSAGREHLLDPAPGIAEVVKSQSPAHAVDALAAGLAWPALRRKLDRHNPGYAV
jgi:ribulose-5-phosphate 4-epimerase/fuculose-1-phosphate aldolase